MKVLYHLISVVSHGESWYNFRSKVQQVMLQPRTAKMYVGSIEEASRSFQLRFKYHSERKEPFPFLLSIFSHFILSLFILTFVNFSKLNIILFNIIFSDIIFLG